MLKNKKIVIGITGGIAAYKVPELIRLFTKNGAEVKTVVTDNSLNFITELTLRTLSNNFVYKEQFDFSNYSTEHISLAVWADAFIIAPCSANTLSKISNGICDNLLTSIACAYNKPIIFAPSMNDRMWENEFIQENISKLRNKNHIIVEPEYGALACGTKGKGRLCNIEELFNTTCNFLKKNDFLKNKKIIITAGGTKENIDKVRYIGNYSSGKMGISLADEAFSFGAEVCLISTIDVEKPYKNIKVKTADDMLNALKENFKSYDILIMAAAVADYKAKNKKDYKIKKTEEEITIELIKNPDIISEISKTKKENQIIVGFCAESENLENNAKEKIKKKNIDFIVANDISREDIGFSSDYNEVLIIDKNLNTKKFEKNTKKEIAKQILELINEG